MPHLPARMTLPRRLTPSLIPALKAALATLAPGLMLFTTLALAGCQNNAVRLDRLPKLGADIDTGLPHSIPDAAVNVRRFHSPPRLAGLPADGTITRTEGSSWKQWRYRNTSTLLEVTVYGLPGGWQSLSPRRIIAGHYGQLRQHRINEIYHNPGRSLEFVQERLFNLNGHTTAAARMRIDIPGQSPRYEVLLLSLDGNHFLRISLASRKLDTHQLARTAKIALVQFRKAQESE